MGEAVPPALVLFLGMTAGGTASIIPKQYHRTIACQVICFVKCLSMKGVEDNLLEVTVEHFQSHV